MSGGSGLPRRFRQRLRGTRQQARLFMARMRNHVLVRTKRDRSSLRVAFVALTESTWKLEPLLRKMEADSAFQTAVAVAPMLSLDPETRQSEQDNALAFFRNRGGDSPVLQTARELSDFDPDIVFLTNPHALTPPAFYDGLFLNRLCCYVPYHHEVGRYSDNQAQYNQPFHNAMWRIFAPHDESRQIFREVGARQGRNVTVTGYPACEPLLAPPGDAASVWKPQDRKKSRIIWAPHHTIDMPQLPYANFLQYAEDFTALAERCRDQVQWAFKPHPLLKSKLYGHPDWGQERTDAYYDYWRMSPQCQLEEDSYVDLFRQSDAMIHDSGSFLAEYLYVDKPVMFLQRVDNIRDYFNNFGIEAFEACDHGRSFADVERFVTALPGDAGGSRRAAFAAQHVQPYFHELPSEKIIAHLRARFPGLAAAPDSASGSTPGSGTV